MLMKKFKLSLITGALFLFACLGNAQNITVSGTVLDPDGEPIPGAGVMLEGTTRGAATDVDGRFSLSAPSQGVLVVSSLGFIEQRVPIAGKSVINVVLVPDADMLEETIVVAFGKSTKEAFTGSAKVLGATIGSAEVSAIMRLKDFSDIVESLKNEDLDGIKEKGGEA